MCPSCSDRSAVTAYRCGMDVDGLLAEQIAYYRARAPEYDDWWERRDRYYQGPEFFEWWRAEIDSVARWFRGLAPLGAVLEIAAGTGNITRLLAPHADSVLALDSSTETLEINAVKTAGMSVEYVAADIFAWESDRRFDTVAFGFWLSHVPEARFEQYWGKVARWLVPGGRAVFVDNRPPDGDWFERRTGNTDAVYDSSRGTSQRTLRDGHSFDIVKVFWEPDVLEHRLRTLGWQAQVGRTSGAFIHGVATLGHSISE